MNRKLAVFVAALIIPGGFIALIGALLIKAIGNTPRGQRVLALARQKAPGFAGALLPERQAA